MEPWLGSNSACSVSMTRLLAEGSGGDDAAAIELVRQYFETLRRDAIESPDEAQAGGRSRKGALCGGADACAPGSTTFPSEDISCTPHLMGILVRRTKGRAREVVRKVLAGRGDTVGASIRTEGEAFEGIASIAADIVPQLQALLREEVADWLDQPLEDSQRCVIQLILDGYDIRQIADRFGESELWVKARYHESLKTIE